MTLKKNHIIIFILALTLIGAITVYKISHTNPYQTEVYKVDNGFGYNIYFKNKLVIKQPYIPAITSKKTFCTEQEAQQVGLLVCTKLFNKENPKIAVQDLDKINITYNCSY